MAMAADAPPPGPPSYVRTGASDYLRSLAVDRTLARCDLAGSIAHVEMLSHAGLIDPLEAQSIVSGLRRIAREIETGAFAWREDLEDVHTNVEVRLTELIGAAGGRMHTGRSRNDQIALDERLYLRQAVTALALGLDRFQSELLRRAETERSTILPGYTHLQRAQPVSLAHHLLAHFWRLERDFDRLLATERRANVSPLGAGALAGSTLPLDPAWVATRLGFDRAFDNSLDAVSDRDPLAELLFDVALLAVHLSGIGEEWVLWTSSEFGFARAGALLGSGSSLMPQKRNPDVAELARAKAGGAIGDLVALLATLKALPLAYDRDLQEDKAPAFHAVREATATLDALRAALGELEFLRDRMDQAARDPSLRATDLAEHLVRQGMPFREAHESVAAFVRASNAPISVAAVEARWPKAGVAWDPDHLLDRRASPGGPSPAAVGRQIERAHAALGAHTPSLSSLGRRAGLVEELLKEETK
ncbi:MAG: argininosuccinate lyase [Thermoplasmata archaeon]